MRTPSPFLALAGAAAALALVLWALSRPEVEGAGSVGARAEGRPALSDPLAAPASMPEAPRLARRPAPGETVKELARHATPASPTLRPTTVHREQPELKATEKALASEDRAVRMEAVRTLARTGGDGARFLLARAYEDPRSTGEERQEIRDVLAALRRSRGRVSESGLHPGPGR